MTLTVSFSSRNSPLTSTVIFLVKSPFATAVVTVAMLRTCAVKFPAMRLTFSVKSLHFTRHPRHFRSKSAELIDHRVHDFGRAQKFTFEWPAFYLSRHRFGQIALRHRADNSRHFTRRMDQIPN